MKITLLCFGISAISSVSGMEKVYVSMANEFFRRGHQGTVIWNNGSEVQSFYPINSRVQCINLNLGEIKVPAVFKFMRELDRGFNLN